MYFYFAKMQYRQEYLYLVHDWVRIFFIHKYSLISTKLFCPLMDTDGHGLFVREADYFLANSFPILFLLFISITNSIPKAIAIVALMATAPV